MGAAVGFIEKFGLWSNDQHRLAKEIKARIKKDKLKLFRVAWADPHGASRAKTVTVPAFLSALENGYNINVATTTLDASGARTFASFTRGGGMDLDEMTGSPNLIIVPDPTTFRVLPWEPDVGWVLCDEYFPSGKPFHFSPRRLLRNQLVRLEKRGMDSLIGLEVEWYLLRLAENHLTAEHIGAPGVKGRALQTYPVEPGYSYHSETNMDLMHAPLSALADTLGKLELPLRSFENEWGPGQVECTFAPRRALEAADNLVLFRTATRQVCRRMGYFATFMSPSGAQGLLFERLAPASIPDRCEKRPQSVHAKIPGRATLSDRQELPGWIAASCAGEHNSEHPYHQRLPAFPRQFAGAGSGNLGP